METKVATLSEVLSCIDSKNYYLQGSMDLEITGFKPITTADKGEMSFCSVLGKKGIELISSSNASVIISCRVIIPPNPSHHKIPDDHLQGACEAQTRALRPFGFSLICGPLQFGEG